MVSVLDLWLPILLGAVFAFFGGAVAWMLIPNWHQPDIKVLPDEDAFVADVERHNVAPGLYMWPNCNTAEEMKSEAYKKKFAGGPWGVVTIPSGAPSFGRNLAVTLVYHLVVCAIVGFLATFAFEAGAGYWDVFVFVGLACALSYCTMGLPHALYMMAPKRGMFTNLVDGVVYALLTAGAFAGLWPEAQAALPG